MLSFAIFSTKSFSLRRSYRLYSRVESKLTTNDVVNDLKQKLGTYTSSTTIKNTQKLKNTDGKEIAKQFFIKKILFIY